VALSKDRLVYRADRSNRRVQVFTPEGKYVTQVFINREGPATVSAAGLAFSPDAAQRWLYVADYGNSVVVILDRKTLKEVGRFGSRGAMPGQFQGLHDIAADAHGDLYTTEVAPGARVQKFALQP
jgi:DNA-binding beta-propeller fold protein YncE